MNEQAFPGTTSVILASTESREATRTRSVVISALLSLCVQFLSTGAHASAADLDRTVKFDIDAQPLEKALVAFSQQADIQVVLNVEPIGSAEVQPLKRTVSARTGLTELLRDTGYRYAVIGERTVSVMRSSSIGQHAGEGGGISLSDNSSELKELSLEEVVVTAQKREERLQDTPVPVTAISAETLVNNNQMRIQDYYTSVPGFSMTQTSAQGVQYLSLRGVSTGIGGPTVGVLIDDIPNGSSTVLGGGMGVPDLDPGELTRIEVLRGPQGTLYGANSMGGLLNYLTTDPSTAGVSGRVQVGTNSVRNGDGPGYNARGSINVPLSDTWAVRASGFHRREAGYVDNDIRNLEGVNEQTDQGGRLSALWQPSDAVSLKLGAIYQKTAIEGASLVETSPGAEEFQQTFVLDNPGDKVVRSYSAILNASLSDDVTLTSLSGYNILSFSGQSDVTAGYGGFFAGFFPGAPTGVAQASDYETKKFSQEVRVSMPLGAQFDWMIGGYYTKESSEYLQSLYAVDVPTRQRAGAVFLNRFPTTLKEYSVFTNLTYQVTERFDVQFGGRQGRFEQQATQRVDGPIYNNIFAQRPDPFAISPEDSKLNTFSYLLTPRLKLTPDLMMYARFTSGYRPGGVNITSLDVPRSFLADKTRNYELGFKGSFLDRRLSIDASAYYIAWDDIQLFLFEPVANAGYFDNGSTAKSQGVELAFESKPLAGLTIGGWVAWNEAELTEDLPEQSALVAQGLSGDRLPFSSRTSGKLSVNQSFPLMNGLTGFVGAGVSYIGSRLSIFVPVGGARSTMPAYYRTDFTAGVQHDSWSVNLYVNNVTDRRGVLMTGSATALPGTNALYIQPRVIGLSLTYSF
jgi:iron complex outermembrane recepter protein